MAVIESINKRPLSNRTVLITGGARRIGRSLALSAAHAGAKVLIHHGHSPKLAKQTRSDILAIGGQAHVLSADLSDPHQAAELIYQAQAYGPIDCLVNNAAIFEPLTLMNTKLADWEKHININLTAPFLLSQVFARELPENRSGRIVNILDWRSLRPGKDHFPYTISKAALAAMTQSLAVELAPRITVNGLALGAVLPPSDRSESSLALQSVPADRWATLEEVGECLLFLLTGPSYITGEIIHLDGGRHLI